MYCVIYNDDYRESSHIQGIKAALYDAEMDALKNFTKLTRLKRYVKYRALNIL